MYYILDENNKPKKVKLLEWVNWNTQIDLRKIKFDSIKNGDEKINISTVFLGLDRSVSNDGHPILFETMILGGIYDRYQDRYFTFEEALTCHEKALKLAQESQ